MNNHIKIDTTDTQKVFTDVTDLKIQRIKNKIKTSKNIIPFEKNNLDNQENLNQAKFIVNLIGLWHLTELNEEDKQNEKVFYNINRSEMNVLPYGEYKKYNNYRYILKNTNVYFGNEPFAVNIENNMMKLESLHFECCITFKKVTIEDIKTILSKKEHTTSTISHNLRFFDDYSIKDTMPRFKWKTYAYMYGNDSVSYDQKEVVFTFNKNMSFCMTNESGSQYGKFDVKKRELILTYNDGFEQRHKTVFVEYNRKFERYYLYVSEECDRYEGCYTAYVNF